jgi:hypothetical protein
VSSNRSNPLGLTSSPIAPISRDDAARIEHVIVQRPLQHVLGFTGHSIDDVVNSTIAKNHVRGYFKLYKWVRRGVEVNELERQWNLLEP